MKRVKQILALLLVIFLVGLYVTTLILALKNSPATMNSFKAAIFSTIVIPTLLWIYSFIYKMVKKKDEEE